MFSVGIGGDDEDAEELDEDENVETDEDLDLKEFFDILYFSFSAKGGYPEPGENDFVLFLDDLSLPGLCMYLMQLWMMLMIPILMMIFI